MLTCSTCSHRLRLLWASNVGSSDIRSVRAGGCFWSVELAFQRQPGVVATAVGYSGGGKRDPTYTQVAHDDLHSCCRFTEVTLVQRLTTKVLLP